MSSDSEKIVRITLNGSGLPVPDQDPVRVKKDSQKIRWCSEFEFQITIEGYDDLKYGSGSGDCEYKCTTGTFHEVTTYKYSITANGQTNDPEVDVFP